MLRFGHPEDKESAAGFARRSQQRQKVVDNVVFYYRQYVKPGDWPTELAPLVFFPKNFRRIPLSTLQEAARRLQRIRAGDPTLSLETRL